MGSNSDPSWSSLSSVNAVNLLGQIFRVASVLFTHIIIVRSLSHSALSDYSWITALCIFPQTLFTFGFEQSLSFFVPQFLASNKKKQISKIVSFSFQSVTVFSIVGTAASAIVGYYFLGALEESRLFAFFTLTILANTAFALSQIPIGALRSMQEFRQSIFTEQFLLPGLPLLFVATSCLFMRTPEAIIIAQGLGYFLAGVVALHYLSRSFTQRNIPNLTVFQEPPKNRKKWLLFSAPIALMLTAEVVFNWIILSVSGALLDDFEVAFIGVALRSIQLFTFLTMSIVPLIMPRITHYSYLNKRDELISVIQKMAYWMACWSIIVGFCLATNRSTLFYIFGEDFMRSSNWFLWLIPGGVIEGALAFLKLTSLSVGQNIYGFWLYTFSSALAAILCFVLAKKFGIHGSLAAGSIGFLIVNIIRVLIFKMRNRIGLYNRITASKIIGLLLIVVTAFIGIETYLTPDFLVIRFVVSALFSIILFSIFFWADRKILLGLK